MAKRKYGSSTTTKSRRTKQRRYRKAAIRGRIKRVPKVYNFVRTCTSNNQGSNSLVLRTAGGGGYTFCNNGATITGTALSFEFCLSGVNIYLDGTFLTQAVMPSLTDFGNLFDSYMIDKVEIMALTSISQATLSSGTNGPQLPYICHAVDLDDANATQANALLQYPSCRWFQWRTPQKLRTIRPCQASMLYNGTLATAYTQKRGYVDMQNVNVPHYGFKMALDNNALSSSAANTQYGTLDFIFKYYIKLRDVI